MAKKNEEEKPLSPIDAAIDCLLQGRAFETSHAGLCSVLVDRIVSGRQGLAVKAPWRVDGYREEQDGKDKKSISFGAYVFTPLPLGEGIKQGIH